MFTKKNHIINIKNMLNIDKIKQKKLTDLITFFVNAIPPLKKELQDLGNEPNPNENQV
jgi:hypothetical protein